MRKRSVRSIKPKRSEKADEIVGKCPQPSGLGHYSDDPKINLLCNIFCETLQMGDVEKTKGKPFQFSKHAENLAKEERYAKPFSQFGMKAEQTIFVKLTDKLKKSLGGTVITGSGREVLANVKRKLMEKTEVLAKLGRQFTKAVGKTMARIGGGALTGAEVGSVVPGAGTVAGGLLGTVVGVGMAAWSVYDYVELAQEAWPVAKEILETVTEKFIQVKPDVAILGEQGGVKEIFDYKFPKDRYREGQEEIFREATGEYPNTINEDSCNKCKCK
jgi:hypothetical protein